MNKTTKILLFTITLIGIIFAYLAFDKLNVNAYTPLVPRQISNPQTLPVKGQLFVVNSPTSTQRMAVCANGQAYVASSTAQFGWACETMAVSTGITSLNGSTSSTQTFSSANTLLNVGTSGGIHTFTATTTPSFTTINVSATSTFPSGIWGSNGNVGIGTTTPATKLSVVGTSTFDGLDVGGQFNVSATSTFSGNVVVNTGVAGTSTLSIGQSTNPACIEARDNDDGAFTYITFRDGYMYVNEGQCP